MGKRDNGEGRGAWRWVGGGQVGEWACGKGRGPVAGEVLGKDKMSRRVKEGPGSIIKEFMRRSAHNGQLGLCKFKSCMV